MITPTVGRVVLIFFASGSSMTGYTLPKPDTPVSGLIAYVHNDKCINVAAFDVNSCSMPLTSVRLLQGGEDRPATGYWAEWMPYQIGQAKKHEAKDEDVGLAGCAERDDRYLRAQIIEMALRTPGVSGHSDVLAAAAAYQAHIDGERTASAPQGLNALRPALGAALPGYTNRQ